MLAINPDLCDMERARDFSPDLGELRTNPFAIIDPLFLATPVILGASRRRRRRLGEPERIDR